VPARPAPLAGHRVDHCPQRCLDFVFGNAGALQSLRRIRQQRIDIDDVTGRNAQHRLRLGPVVAIRNCAGRHLEPMRPGCSLQGICSKQSDASGERSEACLHVRML
jgi:hypothetical protein